MATDISAGWISPPNLRGTFDIIWTSIQTITLCAWVSICANIPSPDGGSSELLTDKFHFTLMTFLGPELVFLLAYLQLQAARASVAQFKADGYPAWTLKHAFYADMGGISVKPANWKRFPVNSKQLRYLIVRKYMDYPDIPLREIEGRSKTDGLGRVITIGQTLYFTVTTLARVAQGLAITTLELTVLGFVFCTMATSICWWYKPNDVEIGHTFELSKSMEDIIREAGSEANGAYRDTPLDFVSCERWAGSVLWPFYVNILRRLGLFPAKRNSRPIERIRSINFPKPPSQRSQILVFWLGLAYVAIFFSAWNFYFPTGVERLLWRIFTTMQCGITVVVGIYEIVYFNWPERSSMIASGPSNADAERTAGEMSSYSCMRDFWNKPYNNSVGRHPYYDVPLRSLLFTTPLCAAYCICRWYLLLEDLIGLRSLPSSAYQTVDWTRFWPSF